VKTHLSDFLTTYGITLNDLKILIMPKDERMRELISLQAIGVTPLEAVRYYLALRMAEKGWSPPQRRRRSALQHRGPATGFYPLGPETGLQGVKTVEKPGEK